MFANYLLGITVSFAVAAIVWQHWSVSPSLIKTKIDTVYDYVIVGAGSAGCVLANRLSENASIKVLLLEAGKEEIDVEMVDMPHATFNLLKTGIDWGFTTVPQRHCCTSSFSRQVDWPRGKMLGGSSNLNYLLYSRGSRHDYDSWAQNGCEGWSYEDVLPYFLKSETNRNKHYAKSGFHGTDGPLTVSDMRATPIGETFLRAGVELGYGKTDVNGKKQLGVSLSQGTTNWGRRVGTSKAFLRPVLSRPNLHVMPRAFVTKVLFRGNKATGVEFFFNGTRNRVKARKEVILSAGTVGSAKILLLSGIGPAKHLRELEIPIVVDLPVGNNLQDHVTTDAMTYYLEGNAAITEKKARNLWSLFDYFVFGQGLLTTSGLEGIGFFSSEHQLANESFPHIQLLPSASLVGSFSTKEKLDAVQRKLRMEPKIFRALHGAMEDREGLTMLPILLHPKSRGTIRLQSNDPMDTPLIDPDYLHDPWDVDIMVEGIRLAQKFMRTNSFGWYDARPSKRKHPSCSKYKYDSEAYWRCYVTHNLMTMHDPIGTCKMGAPADPTSVVDPQLRVKGVHNLRVIDASVIPTHISGNINAPVIMIAEKAADIIRDVITVTWIDPDNPVKVPRKAPTSKAHAHIEL